MKDFKYNYNNQSGMFRNKILLLRRSTVTDELLQEIETTEDFGYYWAMVKTNRNQHVINDGQDQTQYNKRYVIKYTKRLDDFINADHTNFEIVDGGITYDVLEAINDNDLNSTITVYVRGRA